MWELNTAAFPLLSDFDDKENDETRLDGKYHKFPNLINRSPEAGPSFVPYNFLTPHFAFVIYNCSTEKKG